MKSANFPDEWKRWIWANIDRGCDRVEIGRILLDEGFDHRLIQKELNFKWTRNETTGFASSTACRRASELGGDYFPLATRLGQAGIELYQIDDFVTKEECRRLRELADTDMQRSSVTNPDNTDADFRNSRTCQIGQSRDPLVLDLHRRICAYLGINPSYSESMQLHVYGPREQFKLHTDAFEPFSAEYDEYAGAQGQRTWSVLLYLNDVDVVAGGATVFPQAGITVQPRSGRMLFWNNLLPNGEPVAETAHESLPLLAGEKAVITNWFRQHGRGPERVKTSREYLPAYTRNGFEYSRIPGFLFGELAQYFKENNRRAAPERVAQDFLKNQQGVTSHLLELPDLIRRKLLIGLRSRCEAWSGLKLEPVVVYGIRRYNRGAMLLPHGDTISSHVISAVLNVAQKVDRPWPLLIEDHLYRSHHCELAPGEILLYEGGKLLHGRPEPLEGEYYANIFVHYKPHGFE